MRGKRKFSFLYSTINDLKIAEDIGEYLVKNKLAACVNIFPIESIHSWKGKIEKNKEYAMIIKTRKKLIKKLIKEIKDKHPYELPCLISFDISYGDKNFLRWIECETKRKNFLRKAQ
jgi:periplasmic divalent cation tolerance protein